MTGDEAAQILLHADEMILRYDEHDPEPANVRDLTQSERVSIREIFEPLGHLLAALIERQREG